MRLGALQLEASRILTLLIRSKYKIFLFLINYKMKKKEDPLSRPKGNPEGRFNQRKNATEERKREKEQK